MRYFNPRSPHGERLSWAVMIIDCGNFNPRSPHGERQRFGSFPSCLMVFQSTLPARGATFLLRICVICISFQSTLPARGATHGTGLQPNRDWISIHAPRTGSDISVEREGRRENNFNPRSPHGERQHDEPRQVHRAHHFNPRSPHGERRWDDINKAYSAYISIHAPRTGSDRYAIEDILRLQISIHAPRTGSDRDAAHLHRRQGAHFNPRSPHGERRFHG